MTAGAPERIAVRQGAVESALWIGPGLLRAAADHLVSPSGRYLLFFAAAAGPAAEPLRRSLAGRLLVDSPIADRESGKTPEAALRIADEALRAGLRRDDAFVAVGGGVLTDLVGFAASIVLRGVTWNAVPTTTAGMADAAIGGKTGVNLPLGKNLIGAFHPPAVVLVDPIAVAGLPDRDYRAGLVEAFKAAWIADASLASRAANRLSEILARDEEAMLDLVGGAARIKAQVVSADPRESGRRRILNFGHTLGHALEAAGEFEELRHGEAVAWGIAAALELSRRRAGLSEAAAADVRAVLRRLGPFPAPRRDAARLAALLARDKKTTARGLASVLLAAIGQARVEESVPPQEWLDAAAIMTLS